MFHPSGSPPSPGERSAQEETIEVPRVEEGVEFGLDVSALTFHPNRTLSEEFSGDSTDAHSDSSNDDFYASGRHKARVRLRRREVTNIDAIEAGFEPASAVPRCYSTNSLSFNGSQFQPRSLSCSQDVCHQECAQTPIRNPRISSLAGYSQDPTPRSISTSDFRLGGDYGRGSSGDDDCFTKISASENRLANMNSSPNTPRRRSLVHTTAPHTPQGYGRDMRQPVSSSRKVAVAPTPQRIDPGTSNRVATHHVAPMQRKSSSGGGNERMVDGSLRGRDDEVSGLNQRVKHLERELSRLYKNQPSSSGSPAYPHQYASPAARDPCHCGTHLEIVLAEKNHKIDSLTSKVEQLTDQLRREQQKVEDLKRERINSRMELDGVVRKLDQLNNRYLEYDKALEEKYAKLEEEYNRLKQEYAEKDHILGEIQSEIAQNEQTTVFVSSQNDRLQTLLDVREREVRELTNELRQLQMNVYEKEKKISDQNSVIMAMSAEASSHVSTSSGSVPLGGDDYDEPSFGRSHRQYTKANSTLGILNNGPVSTNLRKSLSNFALNVAKTDTVTPAMSKDMRECRAVIAECRVLNVGLKDALKCLQGRDARGIPQVLLAMQRHDETDFGNSDDDSSTAVDSRTMSVADAETYVGKTLRCLRDLEGDLETMRNTTMTLMQTAQDSPLF